MNASCLRAFTADQDKQCGAIDLSVVKQAMKNTKREQDVLVAPMLRDAEQKLFAVPTWQRTLCRHERADFDAIRNRRRLLYYGSCCVPFQPPERALGNACNSVRRVQALLQNQPVEQNLGESKV